MAYLGNQPVIGDSANTFKLLDDISTFTLTFDGSSTDVVSVANDTLTFANHRFITGQKVTYTDGGGTVITGLTDGTSYFIIKVDQNTIKLATNASNAASSTAIDLTGVGAGTSHTLNVAFDGVNTKFKATHTSGIKSKVSRAAQISLSINGVIQQPQDTSSPTVGYGVEPDSTIVFSTAPVATDKAFGTFIGEVAPSFDLTDNTVDNFTGDGSTTTFTLSRETPSSQDVLVTLDGVTQYPSDASTTRSYSVVNQGLTFVSAPDTGVAIQARHIGFAGATTSAVTGFYGRTGNTTLISTDDISVQNISAGIATFNTIAVGGTVSIGGTLTYEDVTNIDSVGLITARNGIVVGSGITLSKDGDGFFTGIVTATTFSGALSGSGANITAINASNIASGTVPTARLGSGTASSSTFLRGDSTFAAVTSTTINNNAANRVILGSDTANTLSAPSNLLFDGTNLRVGNTATVSDYNQTDILLGSHSGHSGMTILSGTSSGGFIMFSDNNGGGANAYRGQIEYAHSTDSMRFITDSAEKLRITSAGNIGIGINDPQALTHIYDDTDTSAVTEQLRISGGDRSADTFETGFRFFTQSPSANGNRHYRFIANGNVGLTIQGYETSSGNAGSDRKILLNPDGGDVGVGTDRTGRQVWRTGRTLEIGSAGGNDVAQLFLTSNRGDGEQTAGSIVFADNTQGSSQHNLAIIECDKKGSTANNRGGSLTFLTKSDGSNAPDNAWQMTAGGGYGGSTTDYSTLRHMKGVTSYSSAYNTGDIYIHIDGLYNLPGNAWWYTQVLLQSTEIIGTQAGAHHYLTSITLLGIAQWNSVGVNNVVGSASVSISASTATSCTLFINVNDSSRGPITCWASNTVGQDGPIISFS